jgi:hypothetical protein
MKKKLPLPKITKPNPGSKEAVALGCRCPVLDNRRGEGFMWGKSEHPCFWVHADCPIHGGVKC